MRPYEPNTAVRPYEPNTAVRLYEPNTAVRPYEPNTAVRPYEPNTVVRPYVVRPCVIDDPDDAVNVIGHDHEFVLGRADFLPDLG